MDTNKKFLYFNTDSANQDGAITVPVSTIVAFDVRANNQIVVMVKEAVQTDTTDVFLSKPTGSDPRDIIEKIVNEINFSKDAMIVVGDDNTSEYIHPDIDGIDSISTSIYTNPTIRLGSRVVSSITAAEGAGAAAPVRSSNVGEFNSEIITTMFVDLATASVQASSFDTDLDAIGISGETDPCYITRLVNSVNGYVYKGEFICLETPAGGDTHVGVYASSSGTIAPSGAVSEHPILAPVAQTFGKRTEFTITSGLNDNDYLYMVQGNTQAEAQYTAGKFLIRLYGFKTTGL